MISSPSQHAPLLPACYSPPSMLFSSAAVGGSMMGSGNMYAAVLLPSGLEVES